MFLITWRVERPPIPSPHIAPRRYRRKNRGWGDVYRGYMGVRRYDGCTPSLGASTPSSRIMNACDLSSYVTPRLDPFAPARRSGHIAPPEGLGIGVNPDPEALGNRPPLSVISHNRSAISRVYELDDRNDQRSVASATTSSFECSPSVSSPDVVISPTRLAPHMRAAHRANQLGLHSQLFWSG